jgi:hypothetical protein
MMGAGVSLPMGRLRGSSHNPAMGKKPMQGPQPTQLETQVQTQLGGRARRTA